MEESDKNREMIIKKARDVLRNSKGAIYSLHRADYKKAEEQLKKAKAMIAELNKIKTAGPIGALNDAKEEYTEAACYYSFLKKQKLPSIKELGVEPEIYIGGISDMTGELVRKAINSAIDEDYETSIKIKDFVKQLYAELMLFELKGQLRKKFDSIKYGLEKIEELILQIKLKKLQK